MKPPWEGFTVVGEPVLATGAEVDAAQRELGMRFPHGYREYVTRLGQGILEDWVHIYLPTEILDGDHSTPAWRQRMEEYWFWGSGNGLLTKEQTQEAVLIGDTTGADELVVHPSDPERVLVLPRDSERVLVAGRGLPAAVEWLCTSEVLLEPPPTGRVLHPFPRH
jgi:hypothetical protein